MLRILGVSKSGYYAWMNRKPSHQQKRKETIKTKIKEVYDESKQIYGATKITKQLKSSEIPIGEKTVGNYMKEMGIRAIYRKKWVKTTIDSDFSSKLENLLKRNFKAIKPNTIWVTDITYIWTITGFVYLTSIMDLFSRKIIAWELTDSLTVDCVTNCIIKAKKRRNLDQALIIHSDRGKQYVSKEYIKLFEENMKRSYSKKGDPWDNACIESFHAIIKREWLNRFKIRNIRHAHSLVFEYIETFYNTTRIHGSLGYVSPNHYEKRYEHVRKAN
jgi:transposase InsO family protein